MPRFYNDALSLGYARAGKLMDQMEMMGVVGSQRGSKAREVFWDHDALVSYKSDMA